MMPSSEIKKFVVKTNLQIILVYNDDLILTADKHGFFTEYRVYSFFRYWWLEILWSFGFGYWSFYFAELKESPSCRWWPNN